MPRLFPNYHSAWETEDHMALRKHAAEFFAKEVTPHQDRWAAEHQVDRALWRKAGDAGLPGLEISEDYGGGGGHFGHEAVILQELAHAHDTAFGFNIHSTICAPYLSTFGTDEQKKRWLPKVTTGEAVLAVAMTEPGTGSDLQNIRTTAIRDGDSYVVNGSKTFISNGSHCDLLIIVAKTDPSLGAKGVSLLVAETADLPGFERGRILHKIGQHGQDTRELSFTDMRVPAANLLGGEEGQGFTQLMRLLPRERLSIAISGIAMAEAAVLTTLDYVKDRKVFGSRVLDFQNTQFVLAECTSEILAGKTLVDYCIEQYLDGSLDAATASMAKLWGSDKQCNIIDRCLQMFGGYGYIMEYPIARMYAAARVQKIYGGTNEIMKTLIARTL